jgi:hypothetical protein
MIDGTFSTPSEMRYYYVLFALSLGLIAQFSFRYYDAVLKDGGYRYLQLRKGVQEDDSWLKYYFGQIERMLRKVQIWMDDDKNISIITSVFHPGLLKNWGTKWSSNSFDQCYRFATIYPFFGCLAFWVIFGQNTSGISSNLFLDTPSITRFYIFIGFCAALLLMYWIIVVQKSYFWACMIVAASMLLAAKFTGSDWPTAIVVIFASAFAFVGIYTNRLIGFFAVIEALISCTIGSRFGGDVGLIVGGILFLAFCWIAKTFAGKFGYSSGKPPQYYFVLVILFAICLVLIAQFAPAQQGSRALFTFGIIYIGILPVCNAVWDWISLGFTRFLLGLAVQEKKTATLFFSTILDLLGSALFLSGLSATMSLTIVLVNNEATRNGGLPLVDIGGILTRIEMDPTSPAHYWVYFTLLSTFVPTFFHILILAFSTVSIKTIPVSKQWLLTKMASKSNNFKNDALSRVFASVYFIVHRQILPLIFVVLGSGLLWFYLQIVCTWALHNSQSIVRCMSN